MGHRERKCCSSHVYSRTPRPPPCPPAPVQQWRHTNRPASVLRHKLGQGGQAGATIDIHGNPVGSNALRRRIPPRLSIWPLELLPSRAGLRRARHRASNELLVLNLYLANNECGPPALKQSHLSHPHRKSNRNFQERDRNIGDRTFLRGETRSDS